MQEKQYKIYLFTFPNGKHYCGFTSRSLNKRWGGHGEGYEKCPLVWKAIQKYGWDNIIKEVIFIFDNEEEALNKEKEVIAEMQLTNPDFGYNLHQGGKPTGNADFLTEDGRRRLSEHMKKRWQNAEYRDKIVNNPNRHFLTPEDQRKGVEASRQARMGTVASNAKPVLQIDKTTNDILAEYPSGGQASKAIGKGLSGASNILAVCRGARTTAYGYKWRFKE